MFHFDSKINSDKTKLIFGLTIIATALFSSAFIKTKNNIYYAQTEAGIYTQVDYDNGICSIPTDHPCAYAITEAGSASEIAKHFKFSYTEMEKYVAQKKPYMTTVSVANRIFVPLP